MAQKLIKFLVIWWLLILCFVCVGILMFSHNKKFDSVENAVFFLLCSSIGSWDPSVFNRE